MYFSFKREVDAIKGDMALVCAENGSSVCYLILMVLAGNRAWT